MMPTAKNRDGQKEGSVPTQGAFRYSVLPRSDLRDLRGWKCLYGVSIGGAHKSVALVRQGFEWATNQFDECAILVGDSLYRISLQITKGFPPSQAAAAAQDASRHMLDEIMTGINFQPTVIRTSKVMEKPAFSAALQLITDLHDKNQSIRDSITSDAQQFVSRQNKRGQLAIDQTTAIDLAIHYLHEEIAVYLVLAEEGWLVDVYVGDELPTLERMIKGTVADAPEPLTQRVNVSLRPVQG